MVDYPIGDLIAERVRAMGVKPFYKRFEHNGVNGPNMATVYSDRGLGVRAPVVFYNRANEAAAQLKPGDFDWSGDLRAAASAGSTAAASSRRCRRRTGELIVEGMKAAKAAGAVTSFDLNFREKLWNIWGGQKKAVEVVGRIVENVDVLVGNEEDLQKGLGIAGPEVAAKSKLDPCAFFGMIDKVVRQAPPRQGGRHHAARGALDQPPQLERGRLDRRQDPPGARPRSWTCSTASAAATASRPASSTACSRARPPRRPCSSAGRTARLLTTFPGDTTMATLDQVRAFAKGGSARIQR